MVAPESGKTRTPWLEVERAQFPILDQNRTCEVLVIGAGVAGLSCAYLLAKAGKQVIVVDSGKMCSGETQRTTAHLCDQIDDGYSEVQRIYGKADTKLLRRSLTESIDLIEKIVEEEKIECDFERVDGYLFQAEEAKIDLVKERDDGLEAGLTNIKYIKNFDAISDKPECLKYPRQAQIHSVKYLNGLCAALKKMGVQIYQDSRVVKVEKGDGGKKHPHAEFKNRCTIYAADIIVATNGPIIDFSIQTKQVAYRSFVIAMRLPIGTVARALYWDTADPYHYARLHPIDQNEVDELFIVGGEDHRVGEKDDADDRFEKLINWTKRKFGVDGPVEYKWSGQVYEPTDVLGFIGVDPELGKNIYVATGDSGMGMTNGTIAGILLTDLILGKENDWTKIYSPARQTLRALPNYVKESVHSVSHYAALLIPADKEHADVLASDQGRLLEEDGKKIAAYRDTSGVLTKVSPYCTHLKGVVCWNSCESSWDCPVHGSRFTGTGEVIYGPADGDLEKVQS